MHEKPTLEETTQWQKRLAGQANNCAWSLAEQAARTPTEDDEMLHAAHAAMHLWAIVGDARNKAHAAQLLAHVYALLDRGGEAAHYLAMSGPALLSPEAEPWERALAHAVAANVAAATRDVERHREHYRRASEETAALPDPDERAILEATLRVLPVPPA